MTENTQSKPARSITGKLHRAFLFHKIRFYIAEDFFIFLLVFLGALVHREFITTKSLEIQRSRSLFLDEHAATRLERIWYTVSDPDGTLLMKVQLYPLLRVALLVVAILVAFQLLSILFSWFGESRRIRRILAPLNDLALRAEQLNRMSFGEDKYQRIEDAIERMQADETERLSFGDDDLRGIEAAMNNLLTRMREANMQQARFVNDASHELRTPIAVIQGYADLLDRWGKEDEKVLAESIAAIRHESEHMGYLVEQLLFLARGDAGKTQLHLEETELNAFLREIYEESLMIDESHPYRFVPFSGGDGQGAQDIFASVDRSLLKQAIRILADNAAKYTAAGDEIIFSVGNLYLQVQDTGCGMETSDVMHMFERFYRSEDVRQTKGTGLGLSIAKWIIDKHGAHFEVTSRPGLGTRIRVMLPVRHT